MARTKKLSEREQAIQDFKYNNPNLATSIVLSSVLDKMGVRPISLENCTYQLGPSQTIALSPEDALEITALHAYQFNRKFKPDWAEHLARSMVFGVQLVIAILSNGTIIVLNGHHTLWGIYKSGQKLLIPLTVIYCSCMKAFAKSFCIFDCNKKRTTGNAIKAAENAGLIELKMPASTLNNYVSAVAAARSRYNRHANPVLSEKALMAENKDVLKFAEEIEQIREPKEKLPVIGILSALFSIMYSMDRIGKIELFREFARSFLYGEGAKENPAVMLHKKIIEDRPDHQHGPSAIHMHIKLIHKTWQLWVTCTESKRITESSQVPEFDQWEGPTEDRDPVDFWSND